ncbi:YitT family protein [Mycoplasma struthionis]|uniref:YitT family protein n=1 Tax=Mycoplasma struthionis TaxID=538220 RepID=A0A3G8LGH5_9MOLU|nr:YitT family protein [Mycoplasma struthionis]AZG68611.1 YitT family protein [Mycoplasma struthionis]
MLRKETSEELIQLEKQNQSKRIKRIKESKNHFDLNPYGVNFFNIWVKFPKKMFFIFISAILYNIAVATFLAKAATIATGLSALVQTITFSVSKTAPYFAYIYFLFNLPLVIFFWKKNARLFMVLTTYWLIWQMCFQSLLLIPQVSNVFDKIAIFYVNWQTPGKGEYGDIQNSLRTLIPWEAYGNYLNHYSSWWNLIKDQDAFMKQFNLSSAEYLSLLRFYDVLSRGYTNPTWPIIIYAVIGAICGGSAGGLAWKNSASTAGGDFIVYYLSRVKQKSVGSMSMIIAFCFASFSIFVISTLELSGVVSKGPGGKPLNHGAILLRVLCSVCYIFIYSAFLELIFPKYKKIKIEIYTKEPEKIIKHFKDIKYWHGYNISHVTGGYTGTETTVIETTALFLEQNSIKNEVWVAEPNAWITITRVHNIHGHFDTSKID